MDARPAPHPPIDALRALALGNLDDDTAESVLRHLDACDECRREVTAQTNDGFLDQLRRAHGPSQTPVPAKSLGIQGLPAELASHPEYEVLCELGRGGMGVVYLARNKGMARLEVLKVISKDKLHRPGMVERFRAEIRAAGQLSHQNVVTAYRVLELGDLLAFAMEHVEGQDLWKVVSDRVKKKLDPIPVAAACYYAHQVALGLQHAHKKGLVHRDIKPSNLILARDGREHVVKILDFGLAKVIREQGEEQRLTDAGAVMGTPDYMAPEQGLDAAKADIRADIYSLGCTLYFLLTGKPPFREKDVWDVLLAHQNKEAVALHLVRPDVPEGLSAVVAKMIAKSPAERPQTPMEVAQELLAFATGGKKAGPPPLPHAPNEAAGLSLTTVAVRGDLEAGQGESGGSGRPLLAGLGRRRWKLGVATALCGLLAGVMALWAAGVFGGKAKEDAPASGNTLLPPGQAVETPWVQLFNGKDTAGWKDVTDKARWEVKDGVLTGSGGVGHLFYLGKSYKNFRLRARVMINEGGNSGVIFRAPYGTVTPMGYLAGGYEAQINNTHNDPNKTGSLYVLNKCVVSRKQSPAPSGEWFDLEVEADGPGIVVKVNGEETANYVDASTNLRTGQIAVQVHGETTVVKVSKVEIMELPPEDLPLHWEHSKGMFEHVKGNLWLERFDGHKRLYARETARNQNYVRLERFDGQGKSVNIIHLHKSDCHLTIVGKVPWRPTYKGRWVVGRRRPEVVKSPDARIGEWVALFNGKDLTGWNQISHREMTWSPEDGCLVGRAKGLPGGGGVITHRADFDNFHLRCEAMLCEGRISGLLLRCGPPQEGAGGNKCYLVVIGGTENATATTGTLRLFSYTGTTEFSAGLNLAEADRVELKSGEWFRLEVHAEGNRFRAFVNGKKVLEHVDDNETFTVGRIGLSCAPDAVGRFRDIKIKELPSTAPGGRK